LTNPPRGRATTLAPPPTVALLEGLTPEQAAAVTHGEGPLVIYAGPGAGKTRTLIARVAHLLQSGQAAPNEIVVVAFTNAAASECALRIHEQFGAGSSNGMLIATFHSVCARILRQHAHAFARSENYTIYDQSEVRHIVDYLLCDKDRSTIRSLVKRFGDSSGTEIQREVSLAKNRLWTPAFYAQHSPHPAAPLIAAVWEELDGELRDNDAVDFDDLLALTVRLLGERPDLLSGYRQCWRWLLVDEIQDTNYAQMGLIRLLCAPDGNLTVVGDLAQSLYAFRGAEPRNILDFGTTFPAYRHVALGRNFRSREEIVSASGELIAHSAQRPVEMPYAAQRGPGGRVSVRAFANEHHEAAFVAREIAERLKTGLGAEEIMVLARSSHATVAVQHALAAANIKHRVLGSLGLYERSETKDALAYLTLLVNPRDSQALRRAVGAPKRGVGPATATQLIQHARAQNLNLIAACEQVDQIEAVRAKARHNLRVFGTELVRVRREHAAGRSIGHAVTGALMIDGGLVGHYQARREGAKRSEDRRDAERVLEDLRSLCRAATTYEQAQGALASLRGFLEQAIGLDAQEVTREDPLVTVSTIHRCKGTEATLVIVCGAEERLIPSWRALQSNDPNALEEERRVFYVAMTRAKDTLILTHAAARNERHTNGPSRFLAEAGLL
jgi:DNA helicase-2/ATP-dependent DNA helicase PcrA